MPIGINTNAPVGPLTVVELREAYLARQRRRIPVCKGENHDVHHHALVRAGWYLCCICEKPIEIGVPLRSVR